MMLPFGKNKTCMCINYYHVTILHKWSSEIILCNQVFCDEIRVNECEFFPGVTITETSSFHGQSNGDEIECDLFSPFKHCSQYCNIVF